ncbi:MAG: TCP-1/cpn60 chaperonin family protein [Acidimicrobiia bacterium]
MLRGMTQMVRLVSPTLGPCPGLVAVEGAIRTKPPEILDDGGLILRRMLSLADAFEDMGAMMVRHAAWRVQQSVGDGTTTCVVLLGAMVRRGFRLLAAGYHPEPLSRGMHRAAQVALEELEGLAEPVQGPDDLVAVAHTVAQDRSLAEELGEAVAAMGPEAFIQVESGHGLGIEREYVEGSHWRQGLFSSEFITDPISGRVELDQPRVLLTDLGLDSSDGVRPILEVALRSASRSLLVVAREVSGNALGLMVANHRSGALKLAAVRLPAPGRQVAVLEDLAALTGARVLSSATGASPARVSFEDLGRARFAWATRSAWGLIGGRDDPTPVRERVGRLRRELAASPDQEERESLQERLSKLLGGSVVLRVGAPTPTEREVRLVRARKTVRALRAAAREGVVPGEGRAYLACLPALGRLELSPEERAGAEVIAEALGEPHRQLVRNAGRDPSLTSPGIGKAGDGGTLDGPPRQGEPRDPLPVVAEALRVAVGTATMALGAEVLVKVPRPERTLRP